MMRFKPEPLSPEQISKLPKWAREHVRRAERYGDEMDALLAEVRADRPGAIAVRDHYGDKVPVAWDRHDEVCFALHGEHGDRALDCINVRRKEEGSLQISSSGGALRVTSHASNVFIVSVEER